MYQYHTLDNGLRIIFRHTESAVTHAGVYINVGSRDERLPAEAGMAHFIEHSMFKGTAKRRSHHIRNRIDGVGGELDAFTSKEETCVYATVLSEHLERCIELFADILFHSSLPEHEIEKEKEVVVEEINLYKDSPTELIYDDFEARYFGQHPLAHDILGTKRGVRAFTTDGLKDFMQRHYQADNMVMAVVGNANFDRLVRLCEKYFDSESRGGVKTREAATATDIKPFSQTVHKHTHQAHLIAGCMAPTMFDEDKTVFTLLNNIIGGPAMNSRLNVAIREREGFCYSIESQYVPFTDAGVFYIYAGVDNTAVDRSIELIQAELRKLRDNALTPRHLHQVQRQMIGQMAINADSGLNEMQSIGKAYLSFDHVDTLEEMGNDVMAVTPEQLQDAANRYLNEEKLSYLIYV